MRRLSLSSLAVLSLLSLSAPVLAEPARQSIGAEAVTAHLVAQAQETPPSITVPAPHQSPSVEPAPAPPLMTLEQLLPLMASLAASGQWVALVVALMLGAVLVLLTVGGVRAFLGRWVPALLEDRAGVLLSALVGPLGSLLTSLTAGVPLSVSLVLGFLSSLIASGAWSWWRKSRPAPAATTQPAIH